MFASWALGPRRCSSLPMALGASRACKNNCFSKTLASKTRKNECFQTNLTAGGRKSEKTESMQQSKCFRPTVRFGAFGAT